MRRHAVLTSVRIRVRRVRDSVSIMPTQARVVWDDVLHGVQLRPHPPDGAGAARPHGPAVRGARRLRRRRRRGGRRRRRRPTSCWRPSTTPTTSPRCKAASVDPAPGRRRLRAWAPRTTRPSRACTRRARGSSRAPSTAPRAVWEGEAEHARELHAAACTTRCAATASGFCVYNDIAVGIQWLLDHGARAGGLRRRRRAPRRRRRADLLGRPPGPDDLGARDRPGALPRHRLARPTSAGPAPRAARSTSRCRPAQRRRLAAGVPRRGACRWSARSGPTCSSPSTAATPTPRTRWPTSPSPWTPSAPRPTSLHRLAHDVCERPVGGARRRGLRGRRRRAAHVDAPDRDRRPRADQDDRGGPRGLAGARRAGVRSTRPASDGRPDRRRTARSGGARGRWVTTRRARSTAPSWPRAPPSSPCTASTSTSTDLIERAIRPL